MCKRALTIGIMQGQVRQRLYGQVVRRAAVNPAQVVEGKGGQLRAGTGRMLRPRQPRAGRATPVGERRDNLAQNIQPAGLASPGKSPGG